jgi:hypothetical protein
MLGDVEVYYASAGLTADTLDKHCLHMGLSKNSESPNPLFIICALKWIGISRQSPNIILLVVLVYIYIDTYTHTYHHISIYPMFLLYPLIPPYIPIGWWLLCPRNVSTSPGPTRGHHFVAASASNFGQADICVSRRCTQGASVSKCNSDIETYPSSRVGWLCGKICQR